MPPRICTLVFLVLAAGAGLFIPLSADLKLQMRVLLPMGLVVLLSLLVIPNRRIALVCAWVLAHPLSMEKVFPLLEPSFRGFMGSTLVVSGSDLVLYALTASLFFDWVTKGEKGILWSPVLTPWLLLSAWVLLLFFALGPTANGFMQVMHWGKMTVFLLVFSSSIRNRSEFQTVLVAAAAAVLIQSLVVSSAFVLNKKIAFSSKVTKEAMMTFTGGTGSSESFTRATGTMGHVNQQAMFHVLFTIPLVGLLLVRNQLWRIFIGIVILASFCAVLLTFSRASWIACAIAALVVVGVAALRGRINRVGWLGVAGVLLAGLVCVSAFAPMIVKRLTKGDDGASASRIRMGMLALEHFQSAPLTGVGPGKFVHAQLEKESVEWSRNVWLPRGYSYKPRYLANLELYEVELEGRWYFMPGVVHNKFLLTIAELGLIGLGLFLWFQWRLFRSLLVMLRTRERLFWWLALALLAAFCANQAEYMFELFYDDKTVQLPLFVAGMIVALGRILQTEQQEEGSHV